MDIKQIAASLLGAVNAPVNYGANINDTATNGAELGNIRALGGLFGQGAVAKNATGGIGVAAGQQADNIDTQRKAAAQMAADEEELKRKELERLQDPNEYKAIVNKVGGYDFFDPLDNKISAVEYARKKNMQLTEVYKKSQDPNDKDFLDDYKRVTELGKAVQSGDKDARDKIFDKDPNFKKEYEKATLQEIVNDLHQVYPGYFRSDEEQKNRSKRVNNTRLNDNNVFKGKDDKSSNIIKSFLSSLVG